MSSCRRMPDRIFMENVRSVTQKYWMRTWPFKRVNIGTPWMMSWSIGTDSTVRHIIFFFSLPAFLPFSYPPHPFYFSHNFLPCLRLRPSSTILLHFTSQFGFSPRFYFPSSSLLFSIHSYHILLVLPSIPSPPRTCFQQPSHSLGWLVIRQCAHIHLGDVNRFFFESLHPRLSGHGIYVGKKEEKKRKKRQKEVRK